METGDYETNTLVLNNIANVTYCVYEPPSDQSQSFASTAIEVESSLRDDGHLVFYDATRCGIWYFKITEKGASVEEGTISESPFQQSGHTLAKTDEGSFEPATLQKNKAQAPQSNNTPTSASSTGSAPASFQNDRDGPYENFIAAVLLAVSTAFCSAVGAIPLNYRAALLPPSPEVVQDGPEVQHSGVLGTFGAYMTTTGSLLLTFTVSSCRGLLQLDNTFGTAFVSPGQNILAAPFGIQAVSPGGLLGDMGAASLAQTPNTQALSFRGPHDAQEGLWRQACIKALQLRGIRPALIEGCQWVNISVSRRRLQPSKGEPKRGKEVGPMVTMSWPKPLCFRQSALESPSMSRLGYSLLNGHDESHDPLGSAGRWLHTAADRDEQISKRKADRSAPAPMDIDGGSNQTQNLSSHNAAVQGRPNTGIAGAMYPTPPDGIHPSSGITPSFDGTITSPRNPASATAPLEVEDVGSHVHNLNDDMWEPRPDSKNERSGSKSLLDDPDNVLMGGGDMFDDNDITEADFNFFDEDPDDLDLTMAEFETSAGDSPQKPPIPKTEDISSTNEALPETPLLPDSEGFMKPELKHARSLLNDAQPLAPLVKETTPPAVTKRGTSPFNRETVFKRVRGSVDGNADMPMPSQPARRNSVFELVKFDPTLGMINKKYEQGGLFAVDQKKLEEQKPEPLNHTLPETNYLKRHSRRNRKQRGLPATSSALLKRFTAFDAPTSHASPMGIIGSLSSDGDSSTESDEDDSSYVSDDMISPVKSTFKKATFDEDVASQVTSLKDAEAGDEPDHQLANELPRLSKPEPPEIPLSRLLLDPEPLSFQGPLSDADVVNIAQLITDQAATGFLNISGTQREEDALSVHRDQRQFLAASARDSIRALRHVVPEVLGRATSTRLKGFLEVQDVPLVGQPSLLKPRPVPGRDPNSEQLKPNCLYQIPCHHLEVMRAESKLSVLPTAVSFWESLGLAPASGSKSITALCVFPGWAGMMDNVRTFLERVKSMYELLRLGSFEKLSLSPELEEGLVPFEVDRISTSPDASVTGHGSALIESMEILHGALSATAAVDTNIVVFMAYTPSNPGTIVEACLAFQRFVDSYWKPLKKEYGQRELVLQLVSMDMISSPTSLVMTGSSDLARLCLETYDRCTMFGGPAPAPAIVLEQALPRIIDFKLTNTPSASLIHENSCIHVAYAQSVDDRWVSATWTDDRGSQQSSASYCLGRKGRSQSTPMHEVAHEIWETTLELISYLKVHWRIIITKSGTMDAQEIQFWADLARTESKANISMILMTVDTNPALQLLPPAVQVPSTTTGFYSTPVSTPQTNIVSPEQTNTPATPMRDVGSATAATPGAEPSEPEADAVMLDVTDQTWGAVVGHRLNNSSTPLELQPALVSGYLIKKTSTKLEDPPAVMEVNLVHTEATARAYEPLLREMLSYFRALSTLARARGVVEREADVRPWHVATAEKAVRALYMLM